MLFVCCVRLGYYSEGFLAIQRAVDLSIIGELGGKSSAQIIDVELKKFPYPPYLDDDFSASDTSKQFVPFAVMISFMIPAFVICKDVVLEKEKKLKV